MRIIMSARSVERELRRRGWWEAAQALRASRDNWFVQDCNEFLLCRNGCLSFTRIAFTDDPVSIWLFKGTLGGLEDLSETILTKAVSKDHAPPTVPKVSIRYGRQRRRNME